MDKNYKEIKFELGSTIEEAVDVLLKYKAEGVLARGEFNTHILYSDTVTTDNAYQEIMGKSKDEFDKSQRDWKDSYDKQKREHKENIPNLAKLYMDKGRFILDMDKWEDWDKIVPIRLNDLYKGMELKDCLDIIKILNNSGTLKEAKEILDSQDHSGISYGLVCQLVKEFCRRGQEFFDYVR
jgi:hypothetical protein